MDGIYRYIGIICTSGAHAHQCIINLQIENVFLFRLIEIEILLTNQFHVIL